MSMQQTPPHDSIERAHWKIIKLGDAAFSLERILPRFARRLKKKMRKSKMEMDAMKMQPQNHSRKEGQTERKTIVAGYVYLIRAENDLYKIGKAKDVSKRLKPYTVNFPMKWELVHSFRSEDYTAAEYKLHSMFENKRDVGEWFRLSTDDVVYITSLQDGSL